MAFLTLPANHYAATWSETHQIYKIDEVTSVAVRYVKEMNPAKKQDLLLELVRYFHSYIFKYVSMIVTGSVPKQGHGINKDVRLFLKNFLPPGTRPSGVSLARVAHNLNVAFKDMKVDEVYNILVGCLISALDKYDPDYTTKVKAVVTPSIT